ncbi:hypothetical protein KUTeg_018336 [Tegillarca granosa]|uniref:Uncharacterized protein n=1 Tax=Tegillarca granosa TaxID=220873 RepID=A0ABQ9END5_TEGGR|nr:hypothetical protein KUTeg_018336 [Tegillarca granosa]
MLFQVSRNMTKIINEFRFHDTKPEASMAVPRIGDGNQLMENLPAKKRSMSVSFANGTEFKTEKAKHVTISDESPIETPVSRIHSLRSRSGTSRTSNYTRSSSQASSSALSFSCHSNMEKDSFREHNGLKTATLYSSNDDMSPYIGENPYEERRRMLLLGEQNRADNLADKKDDFLDRVDEYIKICDKQNAMLQLDIQRQHSELRGLVNDHTKELWKDINKCTYLRVPSEKIDLSGIVTLASEQMKLFKTLRPM